MKFYIERKNRRIYFTIEWIIALISLEMALLAIIFPHIVWLCAPIAFLGMWISIIIVFKGEKFYNYWAGKPISYKTEDE